MNKIHIQHENKNESAELNWHWIKLSHLFNLEISKVIVKEQGEAHMEHLDDL